MGSVRYVHKNFKHNLEIAKKRCRELGVGCSVIVKDFLCKYPYISIIGNEDFKTIWLRKRQPAPYIGSAMLSSYGVCNIDISLMCGYTCLVTTIAELDYISNYDSTNISIYIPLNYFEIKEGVTISQAKALIIHAKALNIKVVGVMVNAMCTNSVFPTYGKLEELVREVKNLGDFRISIGGSMFLYYSQLPIGISELRLGEFLWLGNIPNSKKIQKLNLGGKSAFIGISKIVKIEKQTVLLNVGYNEISDKCKIPYKIQSISNEYTVLIGVNTDYKIGGIIEYIPDYRTLTNIV